MDVERLEVEELVEHYTPLLLRIALSVLDDREEARDVCQEVFLRYLEHESEIDRPVSWLYRVTLNLSINARKKRVLRDSRSPMLVAVDARAPDPVEEIEKRRRRRAIAVAVAELPEGQRSAFVLRQQAGMSIKEIAADLGVSEGTVKTQLHRALSALCARLGKGPQIRDKGAG